ncbi:unnamed protein product, partial [Mesorhabditis belari]|uniref:Uncharacterized protein n=1 Tax=Mesorhabditis belari TaxID=2138241 RepID=A0AAF3FB20_9BILA
MKVILPLVLKKFWQLHGEKRDSQKDGFRSPIVEARKTYEIIGVSTSEREAIPVEQISFVESTNAPPLKQQTRGEEIEEEELKLAETNGQLNIV